jgi:hypothetical protein
MIQVEEALVGLRAALLAHTEARTAGTGGVFRDVRVAVDPSPEPVEVVASGESGRRERGR